MDVNGSNLAFWLFLLAVAVTALLILAGVRSRPAYGRRRGLPPGSLGMIASLDALVNQDFYARAASRWGPVFKMAQFHRPVVCVTDLRLGLELLRSQRTSLSHPRLPFGRQSPGQYIRFLNDHSHPRHRHVLRAATSTSLAAASRPGVESVVHRQLAAAVAGDVGSRGIDPDEIVERIVVAGLMQMLCGVTIEESQIVVLRQLFDRLGAKPWFREIRPEDRTHTFGALISMFRECGRSTSRDGSGGSVLGEVLRADPSYLDDDILLGNLVLIAHVTRNNLRGILRWVVKEHVDNPTYADVVRNAQPAPRDRLLATDAMIANFVSETLRLHQSEYFLREASAEVNAGSLRVPKGWLLRVCVSEAHLDPATFPDPRSFSPHRFSRRTYGETEYCPFSDGTHSRFGAEGARIIAESLYKALVLDFEAVATADGPVEREGNRHWRHWRPSRRLRVSLKDRNLARGFRVRIPPRGV